ncbi:16S rRNA (cytosine(967)-C(5))-methyltransferase RsmB [bacterium]|nr:MAG: 16S rRNA (cytosine(967)-C(5))-methyltransferase RsmB [bacterium]
MDNIEKTEEIQLNGHEKPKEDSKIETKKLDPDYNKTLYSSVRACAVKILCRCERSDAYLEKLVDAEMRSSNLNDFDKSLLNEITHGVIRWLRRLDWFLNGFYRGQYEKCLPDVKNAMRVALYQILFLNKIPYSAAVNEAVEFIKRIRGDKHAGVVNGLLRTIIRTLDALVWPTREIDEVNYLGIIQSHPNWMVRRWISRFGFDEAQALCEANNRRPSLSLRVNKQKTTPDEFASYLSEKGINFRKSEYFDYFFTIKQMAKIYDDELFKKGYFTVQDESAGLVGHLLNVKEHDLVLDVCAAPGGKSSHISELSGNRCKIIAIDKYLSRVETMKKNFERLGYTNILAFHEDISDPKTDLLKNKIVGKVDKVLVDAPCSGLGVLSKKPDIKWKREPEDIHKLQKIQTEILNLAEKYVRPGGVLVYSTCTTENDENTEIIDKFLNNNADFEIDNAKKYIPESLVNERGFIETFPHKHQVDGSFSARLIRK